MTQQSARCWGAWLCIQRWTVTPSLYWSRSVTSNQCKSAFTSCVVHERTCSCRWRIVLQRSAPVVDCVSQTWVSRQVPCCNSPLRTWRQRVHVSLLTHCPVTVEFVKVVEAKRNILHRRWNNVCLRRGRTRRSGGMYCETAQSSSVFRNLDSV